MKAVGKFVYKGLEKKDGGEFTNDKGQNIKYDASYQLKLDEDVEGSINERKLKISVNNTGLISALQKLKPYQEIELECDIILYPSSAKVVPVAIVGSKQ